jgi:hypothetical protein
MSLREPIYEQVSEIEIDTSRIDVETVVQNILTVLKDRKRRT